MRGILKFATARVFLAAVLIVAFAGAALEELSSRVVSDATAATITGSGCSSTVTTNGTKS